MYHTESPSVWLIACEKW